MAIYHIPKYVRQRAQAGKIADLEKQVSALNENMEQVNRKMNTGEKKE